MIGCAREGCDGVCGLRLLVRMPEALNARQRVTDRNARAVC